MSIITHPKKSLAKLLAFEFPIVSLAILAAVLNSAWLAGAVAVSVAFWPIRWWVNRRWSERTPLDWAVVLLLLMLPVTIWASAVPEKTLPQVLRLLAGAALFYSLVNWAAGASRLRLVVNMALAAGLFLALAAPFIVRWNAVKLAFIPPAWYSNFRLLAADSINPNVIAGSLVLLVLPGLALLVFAWTEMKRWERLLCAGLVLVGGMALLLSQSRGAWLAVLCGGALLILLRWRYGWLILLCAVILGLVVIERVGIQRLVGMLFSSTTLGGVDGRLEVWSRAIFMLQDFPFTGIGMGAFTDIADRLYPFFLYPSDTVEHAHNLFLQVGVDLGLPGLVAWIAIFLVVCWCAWQIFRRGRKNQLNWLAGLGAGLLAAQTALAVHGLSDAVVWGMVRSAPLVWLLWGITAAATNHEQIL